MLPNKRYINLDLSFWANVKLLNQRLGYFKKNAKGVVEPVIPTVPEIVRVFDREKLNYERLVYEEKLTDFGQLLIEYMTYRGDALINCVLPNLMNKEQAKELFTSTFEKLKPSCPIPMNKQKGEKKELSFLTGLVNMLIESNIENHTCDYDPKELTILTKNSFPVRTHSRRVDGAFPCVKDPIAIWEIKEYYNTTTFGSRVADGVYETQLDGWELWEVNTSLNRYIKHYLIIDDYFTWWEKGRSYLCRLIDTMHMGLVTEVIFGKEIVDRIPILAKEWREELQSLQ